MQKQLKLMIDMNEKSCDVTYYYSMVEMLNHLIHTCFDISTTIGTCSRFLVQPQHLHL